MIRLYIFDLDGTLVEDHLEERDGKLVPVEDTPYTQPVPLAGARERLAALRARGARVSIATNQGGVALGFQTKAEAEARLSNAALVLGLLEPGPSVTFHMCLAHPNADDPKYRTEKALECRKPNGGMLRLAFRQQGIVAGASLFVGDRATDRMAAEDAGCDFMWAEDFLG